jgi:polyribonucleotide nucleotidyltransferase
VVSAKNGEFQLNPNKELLSSSDLNIFVAGRNMEMVMLEADGRQASDDVAVQAIEFALQQLQPVTELLQTIQQEIGAEKIVVTTPEISPEDQALKVAAEAKADEYFIAHEAELFGKGNKRERRQRYDKVMAGVKALFAADDSKSGSFAMHRVSERFQTTMIERIFTLEKRVDDRELDEIRPLTVAAGLIPRVHGSGLFSRGDTQVLSLATLSSPSSEQIFDTMRSDEKRRYFHHYNFPPFSVGEAKPLRGPGRREIGHGALAEKALLAVLPAKDKFPYTIRVVSEVLSSNGSSSQGSICGSSLALMDAGVPIAAPVAGIAMGIAFKDESKTDYRILTDLQDVEDYDRSMDFKVAGTKQGITAIQLDMKFDGLTMDMIKATFVKAKAARERILEQMCAVIAEPRKELSPYAPRIETLQIDPEKIGELIGPGGKMINSIIDATGVAIDIEDDGLVFVTAVDVTAMTKALELIKAIVKTVEVGEVYEGRVVKIIADRNNPDKQIGAIVELSPNQDGMIHISQLAHERVNKVTDVVKEGDLVKVKVMEVDKATGRVGLSRKALLPNSNQ